MEHICGIYYSCGRLFCDILSYREVRASVFGDKSSPFFPCKADNNFIMRGGSSSSCSTVAFQLLAAMGQL